MFFIESREGETVVWTLMRNYRSFVNIEMGRRSSWQNSYIKVDSDVVVFGGFYIIVIAAYAAFEVFAINYRPVLIGGYLEASYPSSTTLLVMCVMPTVIMQLNRRMKNVLLNKIADCAIIAFVIFMVVGRLILGVHWITDIIGSVLLSSGLVLTYYSIINTKKA